MFTVGPRFTSAPLPRSSLPTTVPYSRASAGSQAAASATGAGSWVTPGTPSATPCGPSSRFSPGMHSAGLAAMWPT